MQRRDLFNVTLCITVGCSSASSAARRPAIVDSNNDAMRSRALAAAPIGTPIDEARSIMESAGFRCVEWEDEESGEPGLICRYSERAGAFVTWDYQIAFTCPDGKVGDAECKQSGTGL